MSNPLKVAVVQHACTADKEINLERSKDGIENAVSNGARIIVLPELHASEYFCVTQDTASFDLAEPVLGPTTKTLAKLAAQHKIVIVGSIFERRAAGVYHNTAVVLDTDGRLAGKYRKMHIPHDPGYNEKFYFTPGDQGFAPIKTTIAKLGVLVCWDQWFPEAARLMALAGAELLIYPTAIGWDPNDMVDEQLRQLDAWRVIQRSHAIANGLPVMTCNRVGKENDPSGKTAGNHFWGHSFICGPQGELFATGDTEPMTLTAEIDLAASERVRQIWPYLRDRRIDAYQELLSLDASESEQ